MNTEAQFWNDENVREFLKFYTQTQGNCPTELWGKDLLQVFKERQQPYKGEGFEIECFVDYNNNYWRQKDGTYHSALFTGIREPNFLDYPETYKIYQVRRIEDNEVFSIGDKIGWGEVGTFECTIDSFRMKDGRLEIGYNQDKKFSQFYFVDIERAVKLHKKKRILFFSEKEMEDCFNAARVTLYPDCLNEKVFKYQSYFDYKC